MHGRTDDPWADLIARRDLLAGATAMGWAAATGPLAATAIVTPADGLDVGWIEFPADAGFRMRAYRARPRGARQAPAVMVAPEIFGLHEWIQDIVRRLALHGFHAAAPDLFQRFGDASRIADLRTLMDSVVAQVPDAQVMADLDRLADFLARDGADVKRLGLTGFCWGGRITWLYAAHTPRLFAGVAWYGRLDGERTSRQPRHPIDVAGALKAPILGLYGMRDRGIPVEDVKRMNERLQAAGGRSVIRLFEADHGFLADYRATYSEAASKAAWPLAVRWLKTGRA
ncbi:MAG: dienelactone hydrolase family protein [Sphingomonadaceae bacterium]|uniref:dienelactone hydrolase family protein n=1 Tax=Thermaurantiacus sp. TaxID=2820283 RepID=UPI00298F2AD3|nr:dienelactone hydrolase family protein [Thermaurantiacus sp.]MCS6986064.1 dienelactone hydrolase family protein [Sphingomonadaceae bacterium]MDW8414720.1 dienelactone hydrolase family protein [Thermaurantiacus sp.]